MEWKEMIIMNGIGLTSTIHRRNQKPSKSSWNKILVQKISLEIYLKTRIILRKGSKKERCFVHVLLSMKMMMMIFFGETPKVKSKLNIKFSSSGSSVFKKKLDFREIFDLSISLVNLSWKRKFSLKFWRKILQFGQMLIFN